MMLILSAPVAVPAPAALDQAHRDLKKAAQGFESYFLDLMLKEMRKTVPQDGITGEGSNSRQVFQDMLDQTLADSMARRGDLGIGRLLYDELAPTLGPGGLKPQTTPADNQTADL